MNGYFITGTDTDIGKTIIAGGIAGVLREKGYDVGVYKPVQSGHLVHHSEGDAARLKGLSGVEDPVEDICPYALEEPLAPILALNRAGQKVTLHDLQKGYVHLKEKHEFMIVEGAGGLAVPYVHDGLVVDAAKMFELPLVIVARPNLGTVNHTLLTIDYAMQRGIQVAGVIISGYREEMAGISERSNPDMIQSYSGIPVLGVVPWIDGLDSREKVLETVRKSIKWDQIQITC
ncbi:dethiobiotin synthase [Domibacillus epiphyticus]|uniref:ATP-dependent dethiobiotin synthetase BioD n=1 Tax=Domibacillus epiphyticus TaxID=1714355 RepID=A0A1V2AB11_9BACI|nr:dethiobiotin synthase [Domibacillus epiphyticus]OMP68179.1 dethiobiotin synthase [Domibacillus epiphyticus]